MGIKNKYEELLETSYTELESLKQEVTTLENIRKRIEDLISSNSELPPQFLELLEKLKSVSVSYTSGINATIKKYLKESNQLFKEKFLEFQSKNEDLKKQIDRLGKIDLNKNFTQLQADFIEVTRKDLAVELKKFDKNSADFQTKITHFSQVVTRLEAIDVEKHFEKLQKTLSDIFGAVNSINATFNNVVQTLTGIVQAVASIQNKSEANFKELKKLVENTKETLEYHLVAQDKQMITNFKLLERKNDLLHKELKTIKIISLAGLVIAIVATVLVVILR